MDPYILLTKLMRSSNPPHALLFSGSDYEGKETAAIAFARYLFHEKTGGLYKFLHKECACKSCTLIHGRTHPDFVFFDELPLTIREVRGLKERFVRSSLFGSWKIAVFRDAEAMTTEAANAFLKVLEEPHGKTLFILFAKSRSCILPTLASRTLEVRFQMGCPKYPLNGSFSHGEHDEAIMIFERGSLIEKFQEAQKYSLKNKGELLTLLDAWILNLREQLLKNGGKTEMLKKIFCLKRIVSTTNANPQLLLEELLL